ncbi:GIY-YIG nuclease family protein [Mycoplasmatota bacterium WC30]
MKSERSNVDFPMWRKKVDSSLFEHKGTTIPTWAALNWDIPKLFGNVTSKKDPNSLVEIRFGKDVFKGFVTIAKKGRKTPAYRLWFEEDMQYCIKQIFLMSYMRDIEQRLGVEKTPDIENKIPFWEFLDIEFDFNNRRFIFTDYYKHKPDFPLLFENLVGSPSIKRIDDQIHSKKGLRIYHQDWKSRKMLDLELEVENVLYTLIDTVNKLIYIGEGEKLVKRVKQTHHSIKSWDHYKYIVLPKELSKHRVMFERMLIRDYAMILNNKKNIETFSISEYRLANDKIDK